MAHAMARSGAFYLALVPIRPRSRGARRSLRTSPARVSLRPPHGFNPDTPRRLSTPLDRRLSTPPRRRFVWAITLQWTRFLNNFDDALRGIGDFERWVKEVEFDLNNLTGVMKYVEEGAEEERGGADAGDEDGNE